MRRSKYAPATNTPLVSKPARPPRSPEVVEAEIRRHEHHQARIAAAVGFLIDVTFDVERKRISRALQVDSKP